MPKQILIIDDEPHICTLVKEYFELKGYKVLTANNQAQGVKELLSQKISVLLLDIMMPKISGFEILQVIRNLKTTFLIPVIMLTAKNTKDDVIKALSLNCDDYCTKPFTMEFLYKKVNKILNKEVLKNKPLPIIDINVLEEKILVSISGTIKENACSNLIDIINNIFKIFIKTSTLKIEVKIENLKENSNLILILKNLISQYKDENRIFGKGLNINTFASSQTVIAKPKPTISYADLDKPRIEIISFRDISVLSFSKNENLNKECVDYFLQMLNKLKHSGKKKYIIDFSNTKDFEESSLVYLLDRLQELKTGIAFVVKNYKMKTLFTSLKINLWASIFAKINEAIKEV